MAKNKDEDMHETHKVPGQGETYEPETDKKADPKPKATKDDQAIRDAHYKENGVDEKGKAPKDKVFDADGTAHNRPNEKE